MFLRKQFFIFLVAHCLLPACIFSQGAWVQKATVFAAGRAGVVGFSIGTKGYYGIGWQYTNGIVYADFWEWDQSTNVWTQKANFPGMGRGDGTGFSIGTKGYIGTGTNGLSYYNDFWEWDQATNTWTQKANSVAGGLGFGIGFSIGTKGYVGTGGPGAYSDFWEWDQITNAWTQKTNFGGGNRSNAVGFSINNKGYIGTGKNSSNGLFNDFWEYDPSTNSWTQKANFLGAQRAWASCFSIGTKGYIGTGADLTGNIFDDFYEWDQATNIWTQKANYPHQVSDIDHASFSIGCHGYFGCGSDDPGSAGIYYNDFWEYTPDNLSITATISNSATICEGAGISLSASGGTNYSWNTGDSTSTINVSPTATTIYTATVSTDCGSATASTTVTVTQKGIANFSYEYDPCKSNCVQFTDQSVGAFSWCWNMGDGGTSYVQNPCWAYPDSASYNPSLIINCTSTCADTFSLSVLYSKRDTSALVYIPNAFSPNDDGENDLLRFYLPDNYCLKKFEIEIYDRWGEKVFETSDITNFWDGKFRGEKIATQTLVYYCKVVSQTGKSVVRKGNVSLLR